MSIRFSLEDCYPKLEIPETWDTLENFCKWYMSSGTPLLIPWDSQIIVSDDATSVTLFKKGRYQVELYLVHPNIAIPEHCHPDMESLIIRLGGGNEGSPVSNGLSSTWGANGGHISGMETHGGRVFGLAPKGYAMLTFQLWPEGTTVTSAAIHWCGDTAGPKQEALIKSHNPNAVLVPGTADIRRKPIATIM